MLDLNALKQQKLQEEEKLSNLAQELEFITEATGELSAGVLEGGFDSFTVILFDFQSDFFQKNKSLFPDDFHYEIANDLKELNGLLTKKDFQICVFNYDAHPKAVNQLTAQIKTKFPHTKTLIMARSISPEKAKKHAETPSGAHGYYQLPLDPQKLKKKFVKIQEKYKK